MNALLMGTETSAEMDDLKTCLKATWMTGDYDLFARYMEKGTRTFYRRLGVGQGAAILDVGCGAGQVALIAAREGAIATGCDIATNWLEKGRNRAASEGLDVTFKEGDAECLPYPDCCFDFVISFVGAMFAPRPDLVAAELTRVCRSGGTIAMANWTPGGFVGRMLATIGRYIAPPGMPSPLLWGDEAAVRRRLREGLISLRMTGRTFTFEYPFPPAAVVELFRRLYGPMARAFESIDARAQEELRRDLTALWTDNNIAQGEGTKVASEYLEVVAVRG